MEGPRNWQTITRLITHVEDQQRGEGYRQQWTVTVTAIAVGTAAATVLWYAGRDSSHNWAPDGEVTANPQAEPSSPNTPADQAIPESPAEEVDTQHSSPQSFSSTHRPHFNPKDILWYSFMLEAEWSPGLLNVQRIWTLPGIDPENSRLVAQCLNQLRHRLPDLA
jgi:hypothetical protein